MHSHHALSFADLASYANSERSMMLLPVSSSHSNHFLRKLLISYIKPELIHVLTQSRSTVGTWIFVIPAFPQGIAYRKKRRKKKRHGI